MKRQSGFGLIDTMIYSGLLLVIGLGVTALVTYQNREMARQRVFQGRDEVKEKLDLSVKSYDALRNSKDVPGNEELKKCFGEGPGLCAELTNHEFFLMDAADTSKLPANAIAGKTSQPIFYKPTGERCGANPPASANAEDSARCPFYAVAVFTSKCGGPPPCTRAKTISVDYRLERVQPMKVVQETIEVPDEAIPEQGPGNSDPNPGPVGPTGPAAPVALPDPVSAEITQALNKAINSAVAAAAALAKVKTYSDRVVSLMSGGRLQDAVRYPSAETAYEAAVDAYAKVKAAAAAAAAAAALIPATNTAERAEADAAAARAAAAATSAKKAVSVAADALDPGIIWNWKLDRTRVLKIEGPKVDNLVRAPHPRGPQSLGLISALARHVLLAPEAHAATKIIEKLVPIETNLPALAPKSATDKNISFDLDQMTGGTKTCTSYDTPRGLAKAAAHNWDSTFKLEERRAEDLFVTTTGGQRKLKDAILALKPWLVDPTNFAPPAYASSTRAEPSDVVEEECGCKLPFCMNDKDQIQPPALQDILIVTAIVDGNPSYALRADIQAWSEGLGSMPEDLATYLKNNGELLSKGVRSYVYGMGAKSIPPELAGILFSSVMPTSCDVPTADPSDEGGEIEPDVLEPVNVVKDPIDAWAGGGAMPVDLFAYVEANRMSLSAEAMKFLESMGDVPPPPPPPTPTPSASPSVEPSPEVSPPAPEEP